MSIDNNLEDVMGDTLGYLYKNERWCLLTGTIIKFEYSSLVGLYYAG